MFSETIDAWHNGLARTLATRDVTQVRVVYRLGSETVEIATVFRGSQEFPGQF